MSARIVITTFGSHGDVNPYVALARELRARGHRPVIATSAHYRAFVEGEGVAFAAIRPDVHPDDPAEVGRIMDRRRGTEYILREVLLPALRDSHADLLDVSADADLLVTHPITFAGPVVAQERRLPWVSTVLAPMSFFSRHDLPVFPPLPWAKRLERVPGMAALLVTLARAATRTWAEPVRRLRAARGLPRGGDPIFEGQHSPECVLALFSRVLARPQPDWPANVRVTGHIFHDGAAGAALPPALERFLADGAPPVVFTLGSSAVQAAGSFYRESVEVARRLGRRAVLLVGRSPRNRDVGPLPPGVMLVDAVPHDRLLPRAAATVHQGGIGTLGQALRAGRPMLVVPHAHDQFDNAERAVRLGVARTIAADRYRAGRAAAALAALLDDPAYADRAARVATDVRAEHGVAAACDAIEGVLARRA